MVVHAHVAGQSLNYKSVKNQRGCLPLANVVIQHRPSKLRLFNIYYLLRYAQTSSIQLILELTPTFFGVNTQSSGISDFL